MLCVRSQLRTAPRACDAAGRAYVLGRGTCFQGCCQVWALRLCWRSRGPVATFWEGEIVDNEHATFLLSKWGASPQVRFHAWLYHSPGCLPCSAFFL